MVFWAKGWSRGGQGMEFVCLPIYYPAMAALTVSANRPVLRIKQNQIGSCLGSSTLGKEDDLLDLLGN